MQDQDFQFDIIRDRYFYIIINIKSREENSRDCENVQTFQITADRKEFQSVKPTILAEITVKGGEERQ